MSGSSTRFTDKIAEEFEEIESEKIEGVFPVYAFPETIQSIITEYSTNANYSVDYFGTSIILAASIAIGHTYKAQVKYPSQQVHIGGGIKKALN